MPSILLLLSLLATTGCSSRLDVAKTIAQPAGLTASVVATAAFSLAAYTRMSPGAPVLTVYLEGDGYAWVSATQISDDPTPKNPIALRLAARDPSPSVAYLARPCQYVTGADRHGCAAVYWANGRFAPEIVAATAQAIRILAARAGATRLRVVGYSGGAAIALLLPRFGVTPEAIVTVAGVLDTAAWTRLHALSPLLGSLDPADDPAPLAGVPQVHFVGGDDAVVPREVAQAYLGRMGAAAPVTVVELPGFTHTCCWADDWPALLRRAAHAGPPP